MLWRIAFLALTPFVFVVALAASPRRSGQIEIVRAPKSFGACAGTTARVEWTRAAADKPKASELPVRGWKRVEAPGLRLDTNLPARDAETLAARVAAGVAWIEREFGVRADPPADLRVFNSRQRFEDYARHIEAPDGPSFLDLARGEAVVHQVNGWETAAQALHQVAHLLLRRAGAPPWLEEGAAEAAGGVEIDGPEARWRPPDLRRLPVGAEDLARDPEPLIRADRAAFDRLGAPAARRAACRILVERLRLRGLLARAAAREALPPDAFQEPPP